ncbi:hypothetical protein Pcinc_017724 [Petrolisthes cinctipes]|uniref:Uncharacterized protein n=1 Tax=Petrolisthes cinctipes TaxID=88211 RepID=A0AAE1FQV6_PETCI|nr:hypothetical protein Pcinc_017724 [Petrolisthes cinctipes]
MVEKVEALRFSERRLRVTTPRSAPGSFGAGGRSEIGGLCTLPDRRRKEAKHVGEERSRKVSVGLKNINGFGITMFVSNGGEKGVTELVKWEEKQEVNMKRVFKEWKKYKELEENRIIAVNGSVLEMSYCSKDKVR